MMHTVMVTMEDGDAFVTRINADEEEIREKYKAGKALNMGSVYDRMVRIKAVEILERSETP